jgi:hypothetical protein
MLLSLAASLSGHHLLLSPSSKPYSYGELGGGAMVFQPERLNLRMTVGRP